MGYEKTRKAAYSGGGGKTCERIRRGEGQQANEGRMVEGKEEKKWAATSCCGLEECT